MEKHGITESELQSNDKAEEKDYEKVADIKEGCLKKQM